ncbi:MAG: RecQ family ATP-dependent DNA helicase [Chloroflexi bacterium]|nr:RecQ family ATP-dependent DNA helicase [Chloroflexota bacterium]
MSRVACYPSSQFKGENTSGETSLMLKWLTGIGGKHSPPWCLTPDILAAPFLKDSETLRNERIDFLLTRADQPAVAVHLDGSADQQDTVHGDGIDGKLEAAGLRVLHLSAQELREGQGLSLNQLRTILSVEGLADSRETETSTILRICRLITQIELSVLEALRGGWLPLTGTWNIGLVLPANLKLDPRARELAAMAVHDFARLLTRLSTLYGDQVVNPELRVMLIDEPSSEFDVVIGPIDDEWNGPGGDTSHGMFSFSDTVFPVEIAAPLSAARSKRVEEPSREEVRWFLQYVFRKEDFREGQWEAIQRCLKGKDSVVLLPTGAGKSIAFQLAALLLPGRCIVVDPIISLIDDQIDNLSRAGIDRCIGITSQLQFVQREQALRGFEQGHYLFCYVAPERFQTIPFRESLRALTVSTPISVIVIDEAHCVSEWGHDFRTAYLNLGRISRDYCASNLEVPPLIAMTGTASKIVLKDVQRELGITDIDAIITPSSFDRPELHFTVLACHSMEKAQRVEGFLRRLPTDFGVGPGVFFEPNGERTYAGLVFCPHVDGEFGVVRQSEHLSDKLNTKIDYYSGSQPRTTRERYWEERKREIARRFKRNRAAILSCTKAFGMGIDKPNIRYTVHISLPESIESFYQEAGRAGRDRRTAHCAVIVSNDNPRRATRLLSPSTPLEEIARAVEDCDRQQEDDVMRALWFHVRAFRGKDEEVTDIVSVLDEIDQLQVRHTVRIRWQNGATRRRGDGDETRSRLEKALHRLVIIGVVADYTVDFSAHEFVAMLSGASQQEIAQSFGRYAASYQRKLGERSEAESLAVIGKDHREFVLAVAALLVDFIYKHVELARRSSLNEMLLAASSARTGEDLRQRILDYLSQSEFDERLNAVLASSCGGLDALTPLLDDLVSPIDAAALRGAVARLLGSYPDVPGLLLLRSITEALCRDTDADVVRQNVEAAVEFALRKYGIDITVIASACGEVVSQAAYKDGAALQIAMALIKASRSDRILIRELMRQVPFSTASYFASELNYRLVDRITAAWPV